MHVSCTLKTMKLNKLSSFGLSSVAQSQKQRVVILGAGWAGYRLAMDLDKSQYDVSVISPRNHFLFTPLLPSTAVGTLEFRAIQEPIRTIPHIRYHQATAESVDIHSKTLVCMDVFHDKHEFKLNYDLLIMAPGSENNTFGVKGVNDNPHVFFLKQLQHSRAIRNRLIECFEIASSPGTNPEDIPKLLQFMVVGGGPTSIEFAAELYDFVKSDVSRWYPDLHKHVHVVVVEASGNILSSFSESLVKHVEKLFKSRNVELLTETSVKEIIGNSAHLSNGKIVNFGLCVWSTGVQQVKLISELNVDKARNGRLLVDSKLHVIDHLNDDDSKPRQPIANGTVFALGDCACDEKSPLPMLAQVASQQAIYLAKSLNQIGLEGLKKGHGKDFLYGHIGSLASIGQWQAIFDATSLDKKSTSMFKVPPLTGFVAFLVWRSAYWTKQVSINNKILILMYWFKSAVFGRDISRF